LAGRTERGQTDTNTVDKEDTESNDWWEGQREGRQTLACWIRGMQRVMISGKNRERVDRH
jgi:hypothetical protein